MRFEISASVVVMTMVVYLKYHWTVRKYSTLNLILGIFSSIIMFIAMKRKVFDGGHRKIFFLYLICLSVGMIHMNFVALGTVFIITNETLLVLYLGVVLMLLKWMFMATSILSKYIVVQITPEHSASFTDGFRAAVVTLIKMSAFFLSSISFQYGFYVGVAVISFLFWFSIGMLIRRKNYFHEEKKQII